MSWDIILFNALEKFDSIETLNEDSLVEIDFDEILLSHFTSHKFDNQHVEIIGGNYSIDFFRDENPVSNKMVSLYGENALFELIRLAKINSWQIFDTGMGEMIDLENPSKNGYTNFQNYLQGILDN